MARINWAAAAKVVSKSYTCGHCGNSLASQLGYFGEGPPRAFSYIYICHHCERPTYFPANGGQIPGATFGQSIKHIPHDNIERLYEEARTCFTVGAYTSSVMCCRKLLMNIAVQEGAEEGKRFVDYVTYLDENNYIPPKGKAWVDSIRRLGNEANHNIEFKTQEEAKLILIFTEMLLKFIYEMPGMLGPENIP